MSTPSTPRSPPPTMIPPPSVASYKFPISPLPSHSAVPWRLVYGLFAPLPDGHTYQPVTLLISWDWIPTTETVRLHFTGAGVECTSFLWPTDQEPSFPPLQRVALFFYADWNPSGRRLRVLFEKDNIIRCEYGYDRELEYDKKWILVLILVELVIPILLAVLL
ncbi:hypothetical protein FDECE_15502 [Fusarium decemcellulare]|nr:hypothetical protein FDECE_15502 [Fusarium decemcellulare]